MLTLDVQRASAQADPGDATLREAVEAALQVAGRDGSDARELSIRLVDCAEMQGLNARFRGKDKPTNVLSFPTELAREIPIEFLGDLVICAPVVEEEARQQGKTVRAHWIHMLVHGTLHLLGHDHIETQQAQRMEALETRALASLGLPCPYAQDTHHTEDEGSAA